MIAPVGALYRHKAIGFRRAMPAPTLQNPSDSVRPGGGMPPRTFIPVVIAALIATGIGIFLGLDVIHWFPPQASAQSHNTDRLYYVLVVATIPIFVLVVTVILYSVWQFRMKPGEELMDGAPIHGNTRLELIWTVVPAILILGLVSYSFVVLHDNERKPAGTEIQVNVTGQQFFWTFDYPASVTGGHSVESSVLYLPDHESVKFNMVSKDVIHAFWIPAFRLQEDVVPGITTHYRATPDRLGSYPIVCNLLCGVGHSLMRATVVVVSKARFHSWIEAQEKNPSASTSVGGQGGTAVTGTSNQTSGSSASAGSSSASTTNVTHFTPPRNDG
jgi:cytochrome c oxidase subunit 2